jgi:hypothetical protein
MFGFMLTILGAVAEMDYDLTVCVGILLSKKEKIWPIMIM